MSSWRGYSSYGKSALGVQLNLTGFDEYLAKIEAARNDVDAACEDAVNEAIKIPYEVMKDGAERHRRSGDVVKAIEVTPAKKQGNLIYATVGIDTEKHPEAIHAVFQEYGDGHSPEFPDPFVRPAIDNHKPEIKAAERQVLKAKGMVD
jgi:HK97 gp10 family phage protein